MAMAPRAKLALTIMGSISGVSPTATDIPKRRLLPQCLVVRPLSTITIGTIANMKQIRR
jgi:hypothetical protein